MEFVGADGHHRILAALVLAQVGAQAGQQDIDAERLGDVVVGARFEAEDGVGIGIMAGQHDDRGFKSVLAQNADRLAAIDVGQADVHDDQVDLPGLGGLHPLGPAFDGDRLELVVQRKLLDQRIAQLRVVVDDQDFSGIGHGFFRGPPADIARRRRAK